MKTNCDLYRSIVACSERHAASGRSLEEYLLAMLSLGSSVADRETHSLQEFHNILASSFTVAPDPFDSAWPDSYDAFKRDDDDEGYAGWRSMILRQIVDLHEMGAAGKLEDEYRYFGIDAPRGNRWYNFDPGTYLECAMACMFDGRKCKQPVDADLFEIPEGINWDDFKWFLYWGQAYE